MTVVERLVRRNLVLGGLAALLLLVLVFRPSPTSALRAGELPRLFPDLELDKARTILLERTPPDAGAEAERIRLVRAGEAAWKIESRGDYPASYDRVRAFLEALEGARDKKVVTQRSETFGEYVGPDGWTSVQVLDATGEDLAQFELGKAAGWPDSYVKIGADGGERVVRAHNLTGDKVGLAVGDWVEARLWPELSLPLVQRIDVSQRPAKRTLSFKRQPAVAGEGEPGDAPASQWKMVAPRTEDADTVEIEGLIRAFTGMRLDDVVGAAEGAEANATYGFDRPTYRIVVYAQGGEKAPETKHVLEVGNPSQGDLENPEAWFVRRAGDRWALEVPTYVIAAFERPPEDFLPQEEAPADEDVPADGSAPTDASGDPDGTPPPGDTTGDPDGAPTPGGDATGDPDGEPKDD